MHLFVCVCIIFFPVLDHTQEQQGLALLLPVASFVGDRMICDFMPHALGPVEAPSWIFWSVWELFKVSSYRAFPATSFPPWYPVRTEDCWLWQNPICDYGWCCQWHYGMYQTLLWVAGRVSWRESLLAHPRWDVYARRVTPLPISNVAKVKLERFQSLVVEPKATRILYCSRKIWFCQSDLTTFHIEPQAFVYF